jgi:predicted lipoprotein with Yx(FWY)xxD motif
LAGALTTNQMAPPLVHPVMNITRARRLTALTVLGLATITACGGDDDASTDTQAAAPATAAGAATATTAAAQYDAYGYEIERTAPPAEAEPAGAALATGESSLGTVVVDSAGLTLYAFTPDSAGVPTCVDACAEAWPPALVDGEPTVEGVDAALVTTVEHPAGGTQLVVDGHPLYTFAGDAAPGDVNGHGSGDAWFAVAPDGTLVP